MGAHVWRKIFLWTAPLAFAGALYVQSIRDRSNPEHIDIDRQQAIDKAVTLAKPLGVNLEAWPFFVGVRADSRVDDFLRRSTSPQKALGRKLLSAYPVEVLFVRPDGKQWFRTVLSPDGSIAGYRRAGTFPMGWVLRARNLESSYQRVAEGSVMAAIPSGLEIRLGEPEIQNIEGSEDPEGLRLIWRADMPRIDGLDANITVEVQHGVVTRQEFAPFYEDSPAGHAGAASGTVRRWATLASLSLLFLAAIYGCYRYTRRALELEVPYMRSATIALMMLAFGILVSVIDPSHGITGIAPERMVGAGALLFRVVFVSWIGVQGILVGLAYGAGEGEIREALPGKLTSLDSLLLGKFFSSNVGRSIVCGAAIAAWLLLLDRGLLAGLRLPEDLAANGLIKSAFSRGNWAILLLTLPITGLFSSVAGLLLPMTFLRRHVRNKKLALILLVLAAFILADVTRFATISNPVAWVHCAGAAAALLLPFFWIDYLASIVCSTVFIFGSELMEMAGFTKSWHIPEMRLYMVFVVAVAAGIIAWKRGRRYEDAEVSPQYARNLAQRLSIHAELDAARQAQLRLLPETPPTVPGLSIAASCTPASEVSGDYFDFFPLPGGLLGLAVAEGGNDGLASALAIALTKGFLMVETSGDASPQAILDNLTCMLGGSLQRGNAETGVLYAVIDPRSRTVNIARTGEFPNGAILRADGSIADSCRGLHTLAPLDTLLFYTDGISRQLQASGESAHDLLRKAAGGEGVRSAQDLHDQLFQAVMPQGREGLPDLNDDLTAVVIHIEDDASIQLEDVA